MKKFYIWLSISVTLNGGLFGSREGQHQPPCFLSLKKNPAEWKNEKCVFFFVLLWVTIRLSDRGCAAFVALAVITLAPNQHTTHCFSCLFFSTCIFWDTEKCLRVVQRRPPWRDFPSTQLSSVSDSKMTDSSQACVCVLTSAKISEPLGLPEHTYSNFYISRMNFTVLSSLIQ